MNWKLLLRHRLTTANPNSNLKPNSNPKYDHHPNPNSSQIRRVQRLPLLRFTCFAIGLK